MSSISPRQLATSASTLLLILLVGCTSLRAPQGPLPPADWPVATIALPRVTYGDAGPDPLCHADIYDEVRWMVKHSLENKGYRVVKAELPAKDNSNRPDPWARAAASEVLAYLPANADAILRVRVDRYLAFDLCSSEQVRTLEMDGTAELFAANRPEPIWAGQGKGADTSMRRSEDLPFRVSAELANRMLLTLPLAPR